MFILSYWNYIISENHNSNYYLKSALTCGKRLSAQESEPWMTMNDDRNSWIWIFITKWLKSESGDTGDFSNFVWGGRGKPNILPPGGLTPSPSLTYLFGFQPLWKLKSTWVDCFPIFILLDFIIFWARNAKSSQIQDFFPYFLLLEGKGQKYPQSAFHP